MEGGNGGDGSKFDSVTSSQRSLLKHSGFAGLSPDRGIPLVNSSGGRTDMDSDTGSGHTEVLEDSFSSPVVRTPILTSQDSVFRTPPEEPYLSAVDSDPTVTVLLTDPASASVAVSGDSESPLSGPVRVLEATPAYAPSFATKVARVSEAEPTSATGDSGSPSSGAKIVGVLEAMPASAPSFATDGVSVSEMQPDSAFVATKGYSGSPSSGAENVRVSDKAPASAPLSSPAGDDRVPRKRSGSASAAPTGKFRVLQAAGGAANDSADNDGLPASLKEIIEAVLRNSGEAPRSAEHEKLTMVDILKSCGIRFPE